VTVSVTTRESVRLTSQENKTGVGKSYWAPCTGAHSPEVSGIFRSFQVVPLRPTLALSDSGRVGYLEKLPENPETFRKGREMRQRGVTRTTPTWNVPRSSVRDRVEELFGKSDRRITRQLIKEQVVAPMGASYDELAADEKVRFEDSVRRTVTNHRNALSDEWGLKALPKPGDKKAAHEFIAKLQTRIEDLEQIAESLATKPTARVNALAEIRQIETVIASVRNVDVAGRRLSRLLDAGDGDDQPMLPFMGLVMDFSKVSPETREALLADRGADKRDATAAGQAG
jgi:hypothetical protein